MRFSRSLLSLKRMQTKLMLTALPILLLITFTLSWVSYTFARSMIVNEIEDNMNSHLAETMEGIRNKLWAHTRIPQTLARIVEANGTNMTEEEYRDILLNLPDLNADTLGIGVWYEPERYQAGQTYFGPYAYKDGDQMVYTEEFMTAEYDYPQWEWYTLGMNTSESAAFTDPYYDETTDITMITATVPFYDPQQNLLGVTTGDINLNSMQALIRDIRVGSGGWAFLIDKQGRLIAGREQDNVMQSEITADANASLAALGREMIEQMSSPSNGQVYQGTFEEEKGAIAVYYAPIPETGWMLALAAPERELYASLDELLKKMLIVIASALLVMVGAVVGLSRYLTKHIEQMNRLSARLSEGDFTMQLDIRTGDELERMGDNFNRMATSLKEMMQHITQSSDEVAVHAEQLRIGAEETVKATSEISGSIVNVAEGTELGASVVKQLKEMSDEIAGGIRLITSNVEEVASSAERAHTAATKGNDEAYEMIRQMQNIDVVVASAAGNVAMLEEKSRQVEEIVALIASVAAQTSLLSLNAAIEAARAGEAGRGFGVVAGEVRKLAEQVTAAATQIETTITEIRTTVAETSVSMKDSVRVVHAGLTAAGAAGQSFANINEAVEVVSRQTIDVSAAMQQMYSTMESMTVSMNEINVLTQETATRSGNVAAAAEQQYAVMEQVSSSADNIAHQAQGLKKLVKQFSFE